MEWLAALLAAVLVGAFVQDEGRKRQRQLDEVSRKLDLLLEANAPANLDEHTA